MFISYHQDRVLKHQEIKMVLARLETTFLASLFFVQQNIRNSGCKTRTTGRKEIREQADLKMISKSFVFLNLAKLFLVRTWFAFCTPAKKIARKTIRNVFCGFIIFEIIKLSKISFPFHENRFCKRKIPPPTFLSDCFILIFDN